jgi:hypothetical protein
MSRMKAMAGPAGAQMPSTQATVPCGALKACRSPRGGGEHGPGGCFLRLIVPGDQQAAAQHIDRLIERVVRVRDGPGDMSRDGDLHGREPSGADPHNPQGRAPAAPHTGWLGHLRDQSTTS